MLSSVFAARFNSATFSAPASAVRAGRKALQPANDALERRTLPHR